MRREYNMINNPIHDETEDHDMKKRIGSKLKKSAAIFLALTMTCTLFSVPTVYAQTNEEQTVEESVADTSANEVVEEDQLDVLEDTADQGDDEEIFEEDDTLVKEISIKNVATPVGGKNIDLKVDTGNDKYTISHIFYAGVDAKGNETQLYKSSEKYTAGSTYSIKIYLQPASGYRFNTTTKGLCSVTGTINGKQASMRRIKKENGEIYDASQMICLSYTFSTTGQQSIASVKNNCSVTSSVTYTGALLKPAVKFTGLTKNTDYTVAYSNNKNVGVASVKITGKGNYKGSFTKTFKIYPGKVSISKVTPKKRKLIVHASRTLLATGASYYQIQYHRLGKKGWLTVNSLRAMTTVNKLKKKKRYVVRIRACRRVGSAVYYGAWSSSVKTKKVK